MLSLLTAKSLLLGHVHDPPLLSWGWVPPPPFQLAGPRAVPYLFPVPSCPDCLHTEPWASGGQQCSLCSLKNHSGSFYPNLPPHLTPCTTTTLPLFQAPSPPSPARMKRLTWYACITPSVNAGVLIPRLVTTHNLLTRRVTSLENPAL